METMLMDCGPTTRDLITRLFSPTRNRYYYGKLLDAYHLELEQDYGNYKRWLLNRLSLGAGVLCGLDVLVSNDKKRVRVASGVAIDGFGREIIVPQASQPFEPMQPTDDCGRPTGNPIRQGVVTLYVCFHECEAEPAPALVDECGDSACENGLVRERYRLRVGEGEPEPPGIVTEAQCKTIFATPADGVSRRTVVCETLDSDCSAPDDSCIPIATITIDDGVVTEVDTCTFRPNVYSNTVLLDLILCLAERVDECCGPVAAVKTIAIQSGHGQAAPAGDPLPNPLVARVSQGGAVVANEAVTFDVTVGGGAIGASLTTLGNSFTTNTNASGEATLPIWKLGPTAGGPQRVRASIATGPFVIFNAKAQEAPVANPPVVRAIWPPNGVQLSDNAPAVERQWFRRFREEPVLQITFDRKMRQGQLQAPDPWLRLVAVVKGGPDVAGASSPFTALRLPLSYAGTEAAPLLGISGVTELYRVELPGTLFRTGARFLVQIRADAGNIVEAGPPGLQLDAEFAGTKLAPAQLDKLWPIVNTAATDAATFAALASGTATLPQSGDGIPGGLFHSWFEVLP
jgi:hypothetical protein